MHVLGNSARLVIGVRVCLGSNTSTSEVSCYGSKSNVHWLDVSS